MFAKIESETDYYLHQQNLPIINIKNAFSSRDHEKILILFLLR